MSSYITHGINVPVPLSVLLLPSSVIVTALPSSVNFDVKKLPVSTTSPVSTYASATIRVSVYVPLRFWDVAVLNSEEEIPSYELAVTDPATVRFCPKVIFSYWSIVNATEVALSTMPNVVPDTVTIPKCIIRIAVPVIGADPNITLRWLLLPSLPIV